MLIIVVSSLLIVWKYYNSDKITAENYAPGPYHWQWQNAMAWVRENTPIDSVFAHWWDYGYWIQSIGERSTILDGGNAIVYWDYLMGRYVLTEPDEKKALEILVENRDFFNQNYKKETNLSILNDYLLGKNLWLTGKVKEAIGVLEKAIELLNTPNLKSEFQTRRKKMVFVINVVVSYIRERMIRRK